MHTITRRPEVAVARLHFRFCARAARAACLVPGDGGPVVEEWDVSVHPPVIRPLPTPGPVGAGCLPAPVGDGRVLLIHDGPTVHWSLLDPAGHGAWRRPVADVAGRRVHALPGPDPAAPPWLVAVGPGRSTLLRLAGPEPVASPVLEVPGRLAGVRWCGDDRLAANQVHDGRRRSVVLDTRTGAVSPLPAPGATVLLASPRRGAVLMATAAGGRTRLGWWDPDATEVRHPDALNRITGEVLPLAVDPDGRRLLIRRNTGARSRLLIHDDHDDTVCEVDLPPVTVASAGWGADGPRVLYSSARTPTALAVVSRTAGGGWTVDDRAAGGHTALARLETFGGPAGPLEAVVHGPPWAVARHAVLALHGGPEAAWDVGYHPTLRRLADSGIAVVALNQRGSTGYGAAHRTAIQGAWGGPDLADVRALGALMARARAANGRAAPALYGVSYGAFLALLAAAADPHLWTRCAVAAAFTSAPALYADGSPAVRALIDRLGGRAVIADELGHRDVLRLGDRFPGPLLIIHGRDDPIVPVAHARRLVERLSAAGRRPRYLETDGRHDPLNEPAGRPALASLVDFLREPEERS